MMSRVRAAGEAGALGALQGPSCDLEALKAQVLTLVSADDIAVMMAANPNRARSELKSACRQVFEDVAWSTVPREERQRLADELVDAVLGFGPLEGLLADDAVTEIMVNGPHDVFFEREGRLFRSEARFSDEAQLRALIDRMLGPLGRRVDEASPMANARLPQGHRVHVIIPPLAVDGPVLTIRKFASRVMTLGDMMETGSFGATVGSCLTWAVRARKSIAVSGGTGSGKTTLLNALSCVLPRDERIVTIEDSAELRFLEHPHVVRLEARPRSVEGTGEVTIRDLVINALRMRPDRIVVGECRGAEALDMLQAMNTGHDGSLTTLHANSPSDVVSRLTTMVRYAADLPVDVVESNVASAFDAVVQTARSLDGSFRRWPSCPTTESGALARCGRCTGASVRKPRDGGARRRAGSTSCPRCGWRAGRRWPHGDARAAWRHDGARRARGVRMRCACGDLGAARRAEGVRTSARPGFGACGMAVSEAARRRGLHHAARAAAHALSSLREARARGGAGDARTRSGRIRNVARVRVLGGSSAGRGGRRVCDGLSGGRRRCGGVRVRGRRRAPQGA